MCQFKKRSLHQIHNARRIQSRVGGAYPDTRPETFVLGDAAVDWQDNASLCATWTGLQKSWDLRPRLSDVVALRLTRHFDLCQTARTCAPGCPLPPLRGVSCFDSAQRVRKGIRPATEEARQSDCIAKCVRNPSTRLSYHNRFQPRSGGRQKPGTQVPG